MPKGTHGTYRPRSADAAYVEYAREILAQARKLLEQPPNDSFLGRKTHEPFPSEDDD